MIIKKSNITYIKILYSFIFGVFLGFFYLYKFLNIGDFSKNQLVFLGLYLALFFSFIAYIILFVYAFPRLNESGYSKKFQFSFFVISILLGCFFNFAIPVQFNPGSQQQLKIIATGNKNINALGNEVRLINVIQGNSHKVRFDKLTKTGNWQEIDGVLLTYPSPKSTITWTTFDNQPIWLEFIAHPWSGIIKIDWNGNTHLVDLYNTESTTYKIQLEPNKSNNIWLSIYALISTGLTVGLIILFISTFFLIIKPISHQDNQKKIPWWLYSIITITYWLIKLLAFWPGIMSQDAQNQWWQFLNPQLLNNNLPFFHTLTMWAITRFWLSPAAIVFVQIMILGIFSGWGFSILRRLGVPSVIIFVAWIIFTFSPVNSFFIITVEKDILFSLCTLILFLILLIIITSDGKWLCKRYSWIIFGVVIALITFYRHNGFVIGVSTLIIMILVFRRYSRQFIMSLIVAIILWIGVQIGLSTILGVKHWGEEYNNRIFVQQIIAHIKNHTSLKQDEKAFINTLSPELGEWGYSCYTFNSIMYDSIYSPNWREINRNSYKIRKLYFDLLIRNPKVNISEFICRSSIIWRITQFPDGYTNYIPLLLENDYSPIYNQPIKGKDIPQQVLRMNTKLPLLQKQLSSIYKLSTFGLKNIWRPAIYLYMIIWVSVILSLRYKNWKYLCLSFPLIMHSLFLILTISSQNVRYQYPTILICLMLWPLIFSNRDYIDLVEKINCY